VKKKTKLEQEDRIKPLVRASKTLKEKCNK